MSEPKEWMTIREVAAYLGVSLRHVYTLDIPRTNLGRLPRFSKVVLDTWLAERSVVRGAKKRPRHRVAAGPIHRRGHVQSLDQFRADLRKALGRDR